MPNPRSARLLGLVERPFGRLPKDKNKLYSLHVPTWFASRKAKPAPLTNSAAGSESRQPTGSAGADRQRWFGIGDNRRP